MPEAGVTRTALLAEGRALLARHGLPDPDRESRRLWADLEGLPTYSDPRPADTPVEPERVERFRRAAERRAAGEPLAYVTGVVGFRGLTLRADARALIPRPETEGLVERVLARTRAGRVADLGTGTGCIALSLAAEGRFTQVLGVDRSAGALSLAAENRSRLGHRISLVRGDLASTLGDASLDAIVANPPYLTEAEYQALDPAVRAWEPRDALVSGTTGLDATRELLIDGRRVVRPGGFIAVEIDSTRPEASAAIARDLGWNEVTIETDLFGRARYLLARRSEDT